PFALDLESTISESDILIVSVPINVTEDTIAEIAPKMKAGSLLMDLTSVKVKPVEAMRKFVPMDVEILGTHPMFGPTIQTIRRQTVILVPVTGRSEKWFPVIRKLFEESGEISSLVRAQDEEGFARKMKAAARKYGDTAQALSKSDKLINSKIAEYETILNSIGKVCGFSHFYSGKTHVGTLEKFSQNEVVLKKLISKGTAPQIKNQFIKLKLENLRLLSESELRQWR